MKYANPGTKNMMILQETYETYTEIHVKDEGERHSKGRVESDFSALLIAERERRT